MIYYDKNGIVIRDLQQSDAQIITEEEIAQGWQTTIDKFEMRLRHRAEGKAIAFSYSDVVYLGVGLHSGYGSAQRMYVKRGYIPDGSGVWYKDQVCEPYHDCRNDDDLVLYLSKQSRKSHEGGERECLV